jgi:peptidoglycan glycosyltransferase
MLATDRTRRPLGRTIGHIGLVIAIAFGSLAGAAGYWGVVAAPDLVRSPNDPAVIAAARTVERGTITDRTGATLARNGRDENGELYRVYRHPAISHVVGYSSRRFGAAGLERAYSAELAGLAVDPVADAMRKFGSDPFDPQNLRLSLSFRLQRVAVELLGDRRGAVVMLDPTTGEVYVLASTPTFDASLITGPDGAAAAAAFEALQGSDRQPLLPRATLGRYVPGSIFKIVTAVAGLGSGAITPETTFEEQAEAGADGLLVQGFRIRESHRLRRGEALNLAEATEISSNIYYALVGLRTGGEDLSSWAGRLGFGAPLPFDLPTAVSQVTNGRGDDPGGFVDDVELASAAYGQGETLVTPLQMALVASTVANDGVLMRPRLVTSLTGKNGTRRIGPDEIGRVLSPADARAIQVAMRRAVEGELGRQFTTGAKVEGVPTAGKSGTAELGGAGESHSWFIGFAPVDQPRIAIAVLVEQAGRGGAVAAPMAGDLMERFFEEFPDE